MSIFKRVTATVPLAFILLVTRGFPGLTATYSSYATSDECTASGGSVVTVNYCDRTSCATGSGLTVRLGDYWVVCEYADETNDTDDEEAKPTEQAVSDCNEIWKREGLVKSAKCFANQLIGNCRPGVGSAPGMMLDEIGRQVDREMCAAVCEGRHEQEKLGECSCQ
jgi:hypothetical protein